MKCYIIESIKDTTLTGKYLYGLLFKYNHGEFKDKVFYRPIDNTEELKTTLSDISSEVVSEEDVMIDIETHGCDEGIVLSNNELVVWNDLLKMIKCVNEKSNERVVLMLSSCLSFKVLDANESVNDFSKYVIYSSGILESGAIVRFNTRFIPLFLGGEDILNAFDHVKKETNIGSIKLHELN